MQPIRFHCSAALPATPERISALILDVANWPRFQGYGPLPGIRAAEFLVRTPEVVGSRIRVSNTDGSSHVEEIVAWRPDREVQLKFQEFSPPVSRLATHFLETWELQAAGSETLVKRSFELHPRSVLTMPLLWLISWLLQRAIAKNLADIRNLSTDQPPLPE